MNAPTSRRRLLLSLSVAAGTAAVGVPALAHGERGNDRDEDDGFRQGKLFMSTNAVAGNVLQVFARAPQGPASLIASLPTGGQGTGGGLGSQGAVALSTSGRYLFVVNAGSHSVSTFRLGRRGAELVSTVPSGGSTPTSVAESDGLVYVLNAPAAGIGNVVAGFRNEGGMLRPLADGTRALADRSAPAQVGFDADGELLVISERAATQLVAYRVRRHGELELEPTVMPSPGATPFGFGITRRNVLVVSEAGTSSASSYRIGERRGAPLQLVSPAVANGQGAACWIAVTPNGRFAYSANAAASNVSSYAIDVQGALTLLAAQAGFTSGNGALDMAVTPDGRQLHVFASRAPQQIVSFTIAPDGGLTRIGVLGGITPGSAGLVAN
ncbi:MAG: beta-propeller fold lactonase family protein [Piscinibacter sp.]|nr:beta-propeller fold lactonase family protein [Piscinibacter sp.]